MLRAGGASQPATRARSSRAEYRQRWLKKAWEENHGVLDYPALADRFQVNVRTIQRDVAALRPELMAGLPPIKEQAA
jgi:hypothetical protein